MRGIKVCLGLGSHAMTLGHTLRLHALIHKHTHTQHSILSNLENMISDRVKTTDTVIVN